MENQEIIKTEEVHSKRGRKKIIKEKSISTPLETTSEVDLDGLIKKIKELKERLDNINTEKKNVQQSHKELQKEISKAIDNLVK
jgi:ribosomal protein S15P/S13E